MTSTALEFLFSVIHVLISVYVLDECIDNLHLYLLIHLSYVLYSASIRHAGISAIEIQFYYYYNY